MSVADRLNKLTTDITNAYTSIENKGGTIPANKNTNNLHTAIDSIEVIEQATAEGESLSLTNTKAMPYSDYVVKGKSEQSGEPSPSNPSEIHSVADDVNLLNLDNCTFENCTLNKDESIKSNINNSYFCTIETTQLNSFLMQNLGKSFIFSIKDAIENKQISIVVYGSRTGGGTYQEATVYSTSRKVTISLANDFTNITKIAFRINRSSTPFTDTTTVIKELKFEKGTEATPYSPYNQGTVTIKQENIKNYLNWNKFIDYTNWTNSNSPGYKSFEITGLDINKTYTLCRTDTAGYGEEYKYAGFNKSNNNGNMFLYSTDSSKNLQSVSDIPSEDGKIYINLYGVNSQNDLDQYISIIKKCWVIEGTEYQEYVNNNYTIQTEPLRSLPNGVKDTIEADGIHRRVGRIVLNGTETWLENSAWNYTNTNCYIYSLGITNNNIISNNFKYNGAAYYTDISGIMGIVQTSRLLFRISNTIANSKSDFQAWLSTHNTEVLYPLAEEIIEPLTQNQATTMLDIIKTGSYEGTTNIYTDEDVKPTIGVGYYKKS